MQIFISYAHEDARAVETLASTLRAAGYQVWSDGRFGGGEDFRREIEAQLDKSDIVLVVWSKESTKSRYVLDEADRAVERGVLLPVRIDSSAPPLGFGAFHVHDLSAWDGEAVSDQWQKLLSRLSGFRPSPGASSARSKSLFRAAAVITLIWALAIATVLYASSPNPAGSLLTPVIEAVLIGMVFSAPVVAWSTVELHRSGFVAPQFLIRRTARSFLIGAGISTAVIVPAVASGVIADLEPRAAMLNLIRNTVFLGAAIAAVIGASRLVRWWMRAPHSR